MFYYPTEQKVRCDIGLESVRASARTITGLPFDGSASYFTGLYQMKIELLLERKPRIQVRRKFRKRFFGYL